MISEKGSERKMDRPTEKKNNIFSHHSFLPQSFQDLVPRGPSLAHRSSTSLTIWRAAKVKECIRNRRSSCSMQSLESPEGKKRYQFDLKNKKKYNSKIEKKAQC